MGRTPQVTAVTLVFDDGTKLDVSAADPTVQNLHYEKRRNGPKPSPKGQNDWWQNVLRWTSEIPEGEKELKGDD